MNGQSAKLSYLPTRSHHIITSSPAEPTSCDCPEIPPWNRTKPPPRKCGVIGDTFRYTCVVGYRRKAGTSNLIKCLQEDGVAKWRRPNLDCICEYFSSSSLQKEELWYSTPTGMRLLPFSCLSDKHVNPRYTSVTRVLLRSLCLQQPSLWIWWAHKPFASCCTFTDWCIKSQPCLHLRCKLGLHLNFFRSPSRPFSTISSDLHFATPAGKVRSSFSIQMSVPLLCTSPHLLIFSKQHLFCSSFDP